MKLWLLIGYQDGRHDHWEWPLIAQSLDGAQHRAYRIGQRVGRIVRRIKGEG